MISGAHVILFTPAAEATREFLPDALGLSSVDAGRGWLIFALPASEVAVHPAEHPSHELYLMCDDLEATMANLTGAGATFGPIHEERWGRVTVMPIPGGTQLSIYQPSHPSPSSAPDRHCVGTLQLSRDEDSVVTASTPLSAYLAEPSGSSRRRHDPNRTCD